MADSLSDSTPSPAPGEPGRSSPAADLESTAALVTRLRSGEEAALACLYQRYSAVVHGLALRMLGTETDAEEVVVDVFVRAWTGIGGFDAGRGTLCTWLLTMARSRALDRLRKRRRRAEVLSDAAAAGDGALALPVGSNGESEAQLECRRALEPLLGRLSHPQREVIQLAYFAGLSQREISDTLGAPIGTVKSRMRTGMRKLRAWAGGEEATP